MQQFGWTGNPACDPLSPSFDKSRPKSCNYTEQISDPEWVAGVTANVSFVMHHPALLGYYICDDCCPVNDNFHNVGLQARLYQLIKSIDPYHIVTGAVQCSITWPWTDVPSNPSLPSLPAVSGLPEQPALQLSLDYFLVENCERSLSLCLFFSLSLCLSVSLSLSLPGCLTLSQCISDGALAINHLADAGVRQGNHNGAICNCNGLWAQGAGSPGEFDDYPSAPASLQTVMWL